MKVKDLFDVKYGVNLELLTCETTTAADTDGVNFVARTSNNNGVVAVVKKIEGVSPQAAGTLSCASGGSVLETFVQTKPYYSGRDLYVLTPKNEMSLSEKLYYCMCIKANAYKYSYGRQANKTLKDIELPDTIPQWIYATKAIPITTTKTNANSPPLEMDKWNEFKVGDLFSRFETCKCSVARDLSDGDDCYYIGAKKNDNGIMRRVAYDVDLITKGNCIVFICDGQGSVGYANYMNIDFIGSTTLTVGYNESLNKYVGMFLVSVLDLERPKYSFGRKYRTKLANTIIRLPATKQGSPAGLTHEKKSC
jgi:hypothetical protein